MTRASKQSAKGNSERSQKLLTKSQINSEISKAYKRASSTLNQKLDDISSEKLKVGKDFVAKNDKLIVIPMGPVIYYQYTPASIEFESGERYVKSLIGEPYGI